MDDFGNCLSTYGSSGLQASADFAYDGILWDLWYADWPAWL